MLYRKYSDFQVLRITSKGKKPEPRYVLTVGKSKIPKSSGHYQIYKTLGIIPKFLKYKKSELVKTIPKLISYPVRCKK